MDSPNLLRIENLAHTYGAHQVLQGLSFSLPRGMIGCLLGPSGCGKTTVLRCIAGFEPVQEGLIELNGRTLSSRGFALPPEKRHVGMVFQDYALFPHLRVADNIAFGLHATPHEGRSARVRELAELVGLAASLEKYPHEISGGSSSAWPWPGRWRRGPSSCCWTSRSRTSMSSCASGCRRR
jgi:iron(III) transport system ATP-binding protein